MRVAKRNYSSDGTVKYLLETKEGDKTIESAFLEVPARRDSKPRKILCLSSQIGCYYNCRMCANMLGIFKRSLTSKEINEQIRIVLEEDGNLRKITQEGGVEYAFMGIGEPLFGNNVIRAIQTHEAKVQDTRFSLSTVGAAGYIKRLIRAKLPYPVRLELSLHFPNDSLRNEWIRSDYIFRLGETHLSIEEMFRDAQEYLQKTGEKITVNYVIIDGVNNTPERLEELVGLLKGKQGFYVKIMRPNHTSSYTASWKDQLGIKRTFAPEQFQAELEKRSIDATFFESKGRDIYAGCGMMRSR